MGHALSIVRSKVQPPAITQRNPAENLERSLSQLQDCGVSVSVRTVSSKWVDGVFVPERAAFVEIHGAADMQRAESIIAAMQAPASADDIEMWLTVASTVMARSARDGDENTIALAAYTHVLQDYPGDVVRQLLDPREGIPRQMTFFPALKEMCDLADQMCGDRGIILKELEDPKYPREWWEEHVEDYLKTTDWKISYVPGPEMQNCPMPADLLKKCRAALNKRRDDQNKFREERKAKGGTYTELYPEGHGENFGKHLFEEPKVSRDELDRKREAQKKALAQGENEKGQGA